MNIAMSGASGFVGTYLASYLRELGHRIVPLGRDVLAESGYTELLDIISRNQGVINLAGAPVDRRWTRAYKKELYRSRVLTTRRIVNAINATGNVHLLISTSAVGYYPSGGVYDEYSDARGDTFLAELCEKWEREARKVSSSVRLVITRFGMVLAPDGGTFGQMARPARLGIAAVTGTGPVSWIDRTDLARAMEFIIMHPSMKGIYNFTAPQELTRKEFADHLARYYHSKFTVRIPELAFRMMYGEGAEFLTRGQAALPKRLTEAGFRFNSPDIDRFLMQSGA